MFENPARSKPITIAIASIPRNIFALEPGASVFAPGGDGFFLLYDLVTSI